MKNLTIEEKKKILGGTPVWQCNGKGHKIGLLLYGDKARKSHLQISNWKNHKPLYTGNW